MIGTKKYIKFREKWYSLPLNLFTQEKIADFSKLPFMLKSTLDHLNDHLNYWCTAAKTSTSNLET